MLFKKCVKLVVVEYINNGLLLQIFIKNTVIVYNNYSWEMCKENPHLNLPLFRIHFILTNFGLSDPLIVMCT